ncbi:AbrB/MazE/SpoVT family DNA-binding domain-containing protein [Candidatus Woesearchaeota archaeon]|nr:AbrB/MazE/SpoVT family DNA-binding domain-containing protein [Candidatus Woesearchaeota archaeon]
MAFEVKVKKWGNSLGVVIPREVIAEKRLREGERIALEVFKVGNLKDLFGKYPDLPSGMHVKRIVRKGWK